MKKLIAIFSIGVLLVSCNVSSPSQDKEMLQKKYPKGIVYYVGGCRYIVADSTNVLDIRVELDGTIISTVKIK